MANRVKGEVSFKLGDKEYIMCYNNGALVELEDQLNMGIVAITNEIQKWAKEPDRVRIKWVRALLWAGLLKHHHMTIEQVGNMIDQAAEQNMSMMDVVGDAMSKAYGEPDKDKGQRDDRPTSEESKNGNGTASSQSLSPTDSRLINSGT